MVQKTPIEWRNLLAAEDIVDRTMILGWEMADVISEQWDSDGQLRRRSLQEVVYRLNNNHPSETKDLQKTLRSMADNIDMEKGG